MDDELIARMGEELRASAPLHLVIGAVNAVQLARTLTRTAKSRNLTPHARETIAWVVHHIRMHFSGAPAVLEAIDRGIDVKPDE